MIRDQLQSCIIIISLEAIAPTPRCIDALDNVYAFTNFHFRIIHIFNVKFLIYYHTNYGVLSFRLFRIRLFRVRLFRIRLFRIRLFRVCI